MVPPAERRLSLHRLAEARSLAYHHVVAERIANDPRLLEGVRARVDEWIAKGGRSAPHAEEWKKILDLPRHELAAFLIERSERADELRQSTPFAGFLEPRERWRLWKAVREEFEAGENEEARQ